MHFGLFNLMTQRERGADPKRIFAEMVEQVRLADQGGFDVAWFAEHHFSNYCLCPSPTAMAIHLAGVTKTIRLGPAVVVVPLHHPLRMMEELAMLDALSDGRAVIGLGSGYQQYEFSKFGVDIAKGRDIFLETLDLLEQYLETGAVDYAGKHVAVPQTNFSLRMSQARPPIYVAGLGNDPETQARVARHGYVPIFTTGWSTLEQVRLVRDKVAASFAAAGGDPDRAPYAYQRYICVTDDRDEARRAVEGARYIRRIAMAMRGRYAELDGAHLKEIPAPDEPDLDTLVERMLVGPPAKIAERLIAEFEILKPTHVSCFMGIAGLPHARVMKSMERFVAEVVPQVARNFGGLDRVGAAEPRGKLGVPAHA